jgi:two-component system alkaline phosphatase synthesis response regulator PhoP
MKFNVEKILTASGKDEFLDKMKVCFQSRGYSVQNASDEREIFAMLVKKQPDVVILTESFNGCSGLDVCKRIRSTSKYEEIIILILSRLKNDYIHIESLRSGADDFICFPVSFELLETRLQTLLRRKTKHEKNVISFKALTIDPIQFTVIVQDRIVTLAKKEFEVLYLLASRPGEYFSRNQILDKVWGEHSFVNGRTVDVHIRKIRKKLNVACINTIKGVGYKLSF